jgi:hypothetical protein
MEVDSDPLTICSHTLSLQLPTGKTQANGACIEKKKVQASNCMLRRLQHTAYMTPGVDMI